jgi:Protein of unknown function (DUF1638)
MNNSKVLVACKIFEKELKAVLPEDSEIEIIWLDAALHCNLHHLEEGIKGALLSANRPGVDIGILYGRNCHPEMPRLLNEHDVETLSVRNCIEAFLGDRATELEDKRTMIMTPGWVRAWPSIMKGLGWDEVDVRTNLGRYERILLIDSGLDPLTDEEILAFFDLTQVPIESEPLDLQHFKDVVHSLLNKC